KMTPEQRARVEAAMKGGPSTDVRKECIKKEKLEKHSAFSNNRGNCTRTVVNSTGSKLEVKIHCAEKQASTDGTLVLETVGSDRVKGTMQMESAAIARGVRSRGLVRSPAGPASCRAPRRAHPEFRRMRFEFRH